jgi:hypothetical protein
MAANEIHRVVIGGKFYKQCIIRCIVYFLGEINGSIFN